MKKILVADDDRVTHVKFNKPFTEEGYEVIHAYDGKEALQMAREHMPDLIILDLTMPEMDGRTVCKELKSVPETKDIKIIMLTAKDEQFDRLVGFEMGADEYIGKPCNFMYLNRVVQRALR